MTFVAELQRLLKESQEMTAAHVDKLDSAGIQVRPITPLSSKIR